MQDDFFTAFRSFGFGFGGLFVRVGFLHFFRRTFIRFLTGFFDAAAVQDLLGGRFVGFGRFGFLGFGGFLLCRFFLGKFAFGAGFLFVGQLSCLLGFIGGFFVGFGFFCAFFRKLCLFLGEFLSQLAFGSVFVFFFSFAQGFFCFAGFVFRFADGTFFFRFFFVCAFFLSFGFICLFFRFFVCAFFFFGCRIVVGFAAFLFGLGFFCRTLFLYGNDDRLLFSLRLGFRFGFFLRLEDFRLGLLFLRLGRALEGVRGVLIQKIQDAPDHAGGEDEAEEKAEKAFAVLSVLIHEIPILMMPFRRPFGGR